MEPGTSGLGPSVHDSHIDANTLKCILLTLVTPGVWGAKGREGRFYICMTTILQ